MRKLIMVSMGTLLLATQALADPGIATIPFGAKEPDADDNSVTVEEIEAASNAQQVGRRRFSFSAGGEVTMRDGADAPQGGFIGRFRLDAEGRPGTVSFQAGVGSHGDRPAAQVELSGSFASKKGDLRPFFHLQAIDATTQEVRFAEGGAGVALKYPSGGIGLLLRPVSGVFHEDLKTWSVVSGASLKLAQNVGDFLELNASADLGVLWTNGTANDKNDWGNPAPGVVTQEGLGYLIGARVGARVNLGENLFVTAEGRLDHRISNVLADAKETDSGWVGTPKNANSTTYGGVATVGIAF